MFWRSSGLSAWSDPVYFVYIRSSGRSCNIAMLADTKCFHAIKNIGDVNRFKGKWQQKFLLSHLKETLKIIYRSLLQNFYI